MAEREFIHKKEMKQLEFAFQEKLTKLKNEHEENMKSQELKLKFFNEKSKILSIYKSVDDKIKFFDADILIKYFYISIKKK